MKSVESARLRNLVATRFVLSALITEVLERLSEPLQAKHLTVRMSFSAAADSLYADRDQIEQVLLNVIDNAIDAMDGKGELTIRTSRELDNLLVEITDSGPGITDAIKAHIFEPFFTTKGVGEGTGMGLDTVYRIVRAHRGEVSVESEPGRTTFQVRLPLTNQQRTGV